jgi:hypothetical protein
LQSPNDSTRDFTAIGDQDFFEHGSWVERLRTIFNLQPRRGAATADMR